MTYLCNIHPSVSVAPFCTELVIRHVWLCSINYSWGSQLWDATLLLEAESAIIFPKVFRSVYTGQTKEGREGAYVKWFLSSRHGCKSLFHLVSASRDRFIARPTTQHSVAHYRSYSRKKLPKSSCNVVLLARSLTTAKDYTTWLMSNPSGKANKKKLILTENFALYLKRDGVNFNISVLLELKG